MQIASKSKFCFCRKCTLPKKNAATKSKLSFASSSWERTCRGDTGGERRKHARHKPDQDDIIEQQPGLSRESSPETFVQIKTIVQGFPSGENARFQISSTIIMEMSAIQFDTVNAIYTFISDYIVMLCRLSVYGNDCSLNIHNPVRGSNFHVNELRIISNWLN